MRYFNLVKDVISEEIKLDRISLRADYVAKNIVMALRSVPRKFVDQVRVLRKMGFDAKEALQIIEVLDLAEGQAHDLAWSSGARDVERGEHTANTMGKHLERMDLYVWPFLYRRLKAFPIRPADSEMFLRYVHGVREDVEFLEQLDNTCEFLESLERMEERLPKLFEQTNPDMERQSATVGKTQPDYKFFIRTLVNLFRRSGVVYDVKQNEKPSDQQLSHLGTLLQRRGYDQNQRQQLLQLYYAASVRASNLMKPDEVPEYFSRALTNMWLTGHGTLVIPSVVQQSNRPQQTEPTPTQPEAGLPPKQRRGGRRQTTQVVSPPTPQAKPRVTRDAQGRWVYSNTKTPLDYVLDDLKQDGEVLGETKKKTVSPRNPLHKEMRELRRSGAGGAHFDKKKGFKRSTEKEKFRKEVNEGRLDVPTMTPKELAKKHGVSLASIEAALKQGIKIEHEHTSDWATAREIALDHLGEDPKYYTKLKKVEESWMKHSPNSYSAEMSDIEHHIKTTKAHPRCPQCRQHVNVSKFQHHLDRDNDVTHWEGKCPSCHTKLTVFNDSEIIRGPLLAEMSVPNVVRDLSTKLKQEIKGMSPAKAKAHIRKAVTAHWSNVAWDAEKEEWQKHMTAAQKTAFINKVYDRLAH